MDLLYIKRDEIGTLPVGSAEMEAGVLRLFERLVISGMIREGPSVDNG